MIAVVGVSVVMLCVLTFVLVDSAAREALGAAAPTVGSISAAAILVLIGTPLLRAARASSQSAKAWTAQQPVDARVLAAKSRRLSTRAIGMAGLTFVAVMLFALGTLNDGAVTATFLQFDLMAKGFVDIARGFGTNMIIAVCAQVLSLILGLALALARLLPGRELAPIRLLAIGYIDLFRGIPALVVIYLVCYGLPLTKTPVIGELPPIVYAVIAITLTYSAFNAENFRSGIQSVHSSQRQAALSLGMTSGSVSRLVVLPQAIRNLAPTLLSAFVALQKDTALVSVVGIIDAFAQSKIYAANYFNLSSMTVVCILFIAITIPQTRLVDHLLAKTDRTTRS